MVYYKICQILNFNNFLIAHDVVIVTFKVAQFTEERKG